MPKRVIFINIIALVATIQWSNVNDLAFKLKAETLTGPILQSTTFYCEHCGWGQSINGVAQEMLGDGYNKLVCTP